MSYVEHVALSELRVQALANARILFSTLHPQLLSEAQGVDPTFEVALSKRGEAYIATIVWQSSVRPSDGQWYLFISAPGQKTFGGAYDALSTLCMRLLRHGRPWTADQRPDTDGLELHGSGLVFMESAIADKVSWMTLVPELAAKFEAPCRARRWGGPVLPASFPPGTELQPVRRARDTAAAGGRSVLIQDARSLSAVPQSGALASKAENDDKVMET
ncbi:hypothetical protein LTR95_012893 [Oleoguttula sp. CCFEE 5521]